MPRKRGVWLVIPPNERTAEAGRSTLCHVPGGNVPNDKRAAPRDFRITTNGAPEEDPGANRAVERVARN